MKCSVCGKEFGAGGICQHCGTDRVTGLGSYSGYDVPKDSLSGDTFTPQGGPYRQDVFAQPQVGQTGSIVCYACGEIIPADSIYCPQCSRRLYEPCPKCGHKCSTQYPACNACGTNRSEYLEEQRKRIEEKKKKEKEKEKAKIQTEQEKKEAQKEAAKIRKELEYDSTMPILSSLGVGFLLIIGVCSSMAESESGDVLALIMIIIAIIAIIIIYSDSRTEENIERWKKEHPNHRATPYL